MLKHTGDLSLVAAGTFGTYVASTQLTHVSSHSVPHPVGTSFTSQIHLRTTARYQGPRIPIITFIPQADGCVSNTTKMVCINLFLDAGSWIQAARINRWFWLKRRGCERSRSRSRYAKQPLDACFPRFPQHRKPLNRSIHAGAAITQGVQEVAEKLIMSYTNMKDEARLLSGRDNQQQHPPSQTQGSRTPRHMFGAQFPQRQRFTKYIVCSGSFVDVLHLCEILSEHARAPITMYVSTFSRTKEGIANLVRCFFYFDFMER